MATNLSLFPDQIDTFIRHSDVGSADLANIQRYQDLTLKDNLTSAESEEMTRLFSVLRDKIWTAEDLNKIQDCMTNLETFFKYQTETYVTELFAQYDARMAAFDVRVDQMRTDVDNKIAEANAKIAETEATRTELIASVYDSTYFDFDNMTYEVYNSISGDKQMEFYNTFSNPQDFFDWLNAAKEEYDKQNPSIEIDGSINLEDYINNSNGN